MIARRRARSRCSNFGLSKVTESRGDGLAGPKRLTTDARLFGTAPYLALEQIEGQPADARSDLFALGVILFENGRRPTAIRGGLTPLATMTANSKDAAPFAGDINAKVPDEISRISTAVSSSIRPNGTQSAADLKHHD
jgi:serine/threonine-protein kinase